MLKKFHVEVLYKLPIYVIIEILSFLDLDFMIDGKYVTFENKFLHHCIKELYLKFGDFKKNIFWGYTTISITFKNKFTILDFEIEKLKNHYKKICEKLKKIIPRLKNYKISLIHDLNFEIAKNFQIILLKDIFKSEIDKIFGKNKIPDPEFEDFNDEIRDETFYETLIINKKFNKQN